MNGGPDTLISSAAADVRHRRVDIGVARLGSAAQQGSGCHDLPRLAIPTLRDVLRDPRLLRTVRRGWTEPFDGRDGFGPHCGDRQHARADRLATEMHGAGTALCDTTSKLRAGQAEAIAENPKEGGVGGGFDATAPPIHQEGVGWHGSNVAGKPGTR